MHRSAKERVVSKGSQSRLAPAAATGAQIRESSTRRASASKKGHANHMIRHMAKSVHSSPQVFHRAALLCNGSFLQVRLGDQRCAADANTPAQGNYCAMLIWSCCQDKQS